MKILFPFFFLYNILIFKFKIITTISTTNTTPNYTVKTTFIFIKTKIIEWVLLVVYLFVIITNSKQASKKKKKKKKKRKINLFLYSSWNFSFKVNIN